MKLIKKKKGQLKKLIIVSLLVFLILVVIIAAKKISNPEISQPAEPTENVDNAESVDNIEEKTEENSATEQIPEPIQEPTKPVGDIKEPKETEKIINKTTGETISDNKTEIIEINETTENQTQEEQVKQKPLEPEPVEPTPIEQEPEQDKPELNIQINYPEKIIRNKEFEIGVEITNSGANAEHVSLDWQLPSSFNITNKDERNCKIIRKNYPCICKIIVKSDLSSALGKNQIKLIVNYEEK